MTAVLEREPDWSGLPENTPQTVRRLLRRCLEKDPHHRLHDIADARIEIDDALAAKDHVPQPSTGFRARKQLVRWRPLWRCLQDVWRSGGGCAMPS